MSMRATPANRYERRTLVDALAALACALFIAARFLSLHRIAAPRQATPFAAFVASPVLPPPAYGWWGWWDQGKYLEEATAWAHAALSPSLHYYLPGYPLLATPFVWLGAADPFLVPDLACLLAGLVLFGCLSRRLLDDRRAGFVIGALLFTATTVGSPVAFWAWMVPFSTTPASVCLLASLLAGLRFLDRPRPAASFLVGFLGACTAWFRPADCLCFALVGGPVLASALDWRSRDPARQARIAAAAIAGALLPLLGLLLAHLLIYGWKAGDYLALSGRLGFEWRLLPLRWVLLVLGPRPLLPYGQGLATVFPWILPGMAGMIAALLARRCAGGRAHMLVAGVALLDAAMFLVYRDLHPPALWRYLNYHYFKWLLPLFGLYAVMLARMLWRDGRLPALAGIGLVGLLSLWRVQATDIVALAPAAEGGIRLPAGLSRLSQGVLAPALDPLRQAYFGPDRIVAGGRTFLNTEAFKTYPVAGGLMLVPLRAMPAEPSLFLPPVGTTLDPLATPKLFRQSIVFGLPCWGWLSRAACQDQFLISPPLLALDRPAQFGDGGSGDRFLLDGWSGPGPGGHWSEGTEAGLGLGVPALPAGERAVLLLQAHGFMAGDSKPVRVDFRINGARVASALIGDDRVQAIALPAGTRTAILRLAIVNPRRPSALSGSTDGRLLGLYIESITLVVGSSTPPASRSPPR